MSEVRLIHSDCVVINIDTPLYDYEHVFHGKVFDSVETIHEKLKQIKTVQELIHNLQNELTQPTKKENQTDFKAEREKALQYVCNTYYILNDADEPEYRKKANEINEELESVLSIPPKQSYKFRIRLSEYLAELGLKKKRYTSGFSYYGMVRRDVYLRPLDLSAINRPLTSLENIEAERQRELDIPLTIYEKYSAFKPFGNNVSFVAIQV